MGRNITKNLFPFYSNCVILGDTKNIEVDRVMRNQANMFARPIRKSIDGRRRIRKGVSDLSYSLMDIVDDVSVLRGDVNNLLTMTEEYSRILQEQIDRIKELQGECKGFGFEDVAKHLGNVHKQLMEYVDPSMNFTENMDNTSMSVDEVESVLAQAQSIAERMR